MSRKPSVRYTTTDPEEEGRAPPVPHPTPHTHPDPSTPRNNQPTPLSLYSAGDPNKPKALRQSEHPKGDLPCKTTTTTKPLCHATMLHRATTTTHERPQIMPTKGPKHEAHQTATLEGTYTNLIKNA